MGQKRRRKELKRRSKKQKSAKNNSSNNTKAITLQQSAFNELGAWIENHRNNSKISNGKELEGIVESIAIRFGIRDLTVKNLMFYDSNNKTKEICDLLVPFGKKLLAFQIKHKTLNEETDREVLIKRAESVICKAKLQFKTLTDMLENNSIPVLKSINGLDVKIDSENIDMLHYVVIVAYPGTEKFSEEKRFSIINGFTKYKDIDLHIFDINDFEKISLELDTLPDLFKYFSVRSKFFNEQSLGDMSELDFLATYKMFPKIFEDNSKICITPGAWDLYISNPSKILERNNKNKISYLYDKLIERAYTSIGFMQENEYLRSDLKPGTLLAHLAIIVELNNFTRFFRRDLGEALLRCMLTSEQNYKETKDGFAFRCLFDEARKIAIVILSVVPEFQDRQWRQIFLNKLCHASYVFFNASEVIGIATDSISCKEASLDYFYGKDFKFSSENLEDIESFRNIYMRGDINFNQDTEY